MAKKIPRSMNLVLADKKNEAFISLDSSKTRIWVVGLNNILLTAIEAQTIGNMLLKYSSYLAQKGKDNG